MGVHQEDLTSGQQQPVQRYKTTHTPRPPRSQTPSEILWHTDPAHRQERLSWIGKDVSKFFPTHGTFKGKVQQYHYASDNYTITYEDNDVERVTYANMKRVVPGTPEYADHQSVVRALHVAFTAAATDAISTVNSDVIPNSYKEARASIEAAGWQQSMDEEMANLRRLGCWTVLPRSSLPPNTPIMGTRWTYRKKTDENGTFTRYRGRLVAKAAGDAGIPIRIGVNAGSLDPRLLSKYGKATPEALVESALWEAGLFEEHGFRDIKISVKHHDPVTMIKAYRLLAAKCDYPLHLGVTEAGPLFQGTIKSATAFAVLLAEGIGDTIRVSLSAPPVEEVKVGISILESLNLRQRKLEIVSCPSCGRAQVDVYSLAEKVQAGLEGMTVPLRVAVMGCVVNGPGEAREADLGVASGNGKGQIFVKGEVIKTVPEAQIVETLIEEAMRLAEEMEAAGVASGEPTVNVK